MGGALDPAAVDAVSDALAEALGEPATVVALWCDAPATPRGPVARLVYAYPSVRLATLRHWRDEAEFLVDAGDGPMHVVALEASKWARLLLKSHGGTLLTSSRAADVDALGLAAPLPELVDALWDTVAEDWCRRLGVESGRTPVETTPAERFGHVEGWLHAVRTAVDAAPAARGAGNS